MKKATVTYVAPIGDNKVVEIGGVTFFDGKSVEINSYDNPHLIGKLEANQHFNVVVGKEEPDTVKPPAKRGRPSNADLAAIKANAEETDRAAKEAVEKAKEAKAEHEAVTKADAPKPDKPLLPPLVSPVQNPPVT